MDDERPGVENVTDAYWRVVQRRASWASIGGAVLVLTLLSGAFAWSATLSAPTGDESPLARRRVVGASESTSSVEPTGSAEPTSSAGTSGTVTPGENGTPGEPGTPGPGRAPVVAYRHDGWLCVASEQGIGEMRVVASTAGRFALSPDGRTIALVQDETGILTLVTVADGAAVMVGPALAAPPSWAPDSTWLAYTGPGPTARSVARDGSGDLLLFDGLLPSVASDGRVVVGVPRPGEASEILVWRAGAVTRVAVAEGVTGLACDGSTIYYGLGAPSSGTASLHAVRTDGTSDRVLVASPVTSLATAFIDFALSPDATRLAYAEGGDDDYSRLFAMPIAGGTPTPLSVRRDCYALRWGADGSSVFLIEGNAYQGEPTSLVTVRTDATGRMLLIDGAGR